MTRLRHFLADEGGTATIEFVLVVPVITTIFFATFESSLFMIRNVMLERSVDQVVRDLRLGTLVFPQPNKANQLLREEICDRSALIGSLQTCIDSMSIWMQPISTANFDMPDVPVACVNKNLVPDPNAVPASEEFKFGTDNQIVLLRICLKEEPLFPTTIVGAGLIEDEVDGNYALYTNSVFVIEPG